MDRPLTDDDAALFAAARVARDFAQLPGAPSPDWCQKAAEALARAAGSTRAWIAVVRAGDGGRVAIERAGHASSAGEPTEDNPERTLRTLARGIAAAVELPPRPGVHLVGDLAHRAPQSHQVARLRRYGEILVGVSPIGRPREPEPAAMLLAFWEPAPADAGASLSPTDLRRILRSAMPVLSERLRLALRGGDQRAAWLSDREQRVLDLLTRGLSVPEVAEAIGRSHHTVHDYVKSLHRKLGTTTRGGLVARALGYGAEGSPSRLDADPVSRPMLAFRTDGRTAFVHHSLW